MDDLAKDLSKGNYIGRVIYNEDETMTGRCKVKVFGLMDDLDDKFVPWFSPASITTFSSEYGGGNFSVPKIGAYVRVRFANNDIFSGEYTAIQNIDPNIKSVLEKENYIGTHVLLYDADNELIMLFQPNTGFTLLYRDTKINVAPTNVITISEPNNNSIISLNDDHINITSKNTIDVTASEYVNVSAKVVNVEGKTVNLGNNATLPAVRSDILKDILTDIYSRLSIKQPIDPGVDTSAQFAALTSSTVNIAK